MKRSTIISPHRALLPRLHSRAATLSPPTAPNSGSARASPRARAAGENHRAPTRDQGGGRDRRGPDHAEDHHQRQGLHARVGRRGQLIKLRGLVQLDNRLFFNDGGGVVNNVYSPPRATHQRGTVREKLRLPIRHRIRRQQRQYPRCEFHRRARQVAPVQVRQVQVARRLELLQSDSWTFFNERSIVTNLVPNRDLGVQASGDLLGGTCELCSRRLRWAR
jgi:hypothetical protein